MIAGLMLSRRLRLVVLFDRNVGSTLGQQAFLKPPETVRSQVRSTMRLHEPPRDCAKASASTFNPKVAGSIPARPIAEGASFR